MPIAELPAPDDQVAFPVPGHRPVRGLGGPLADHHHARDPAAPLARLAPRACAAPARSAGTPPAPGAAPRGPARRSPGRSSRATPASPACSGNSRRSITLICSGDQCSSSLACTHSRSPASPASFAVFGRRARSSACACAASARYLPRSRCYGATSRLTVDGARPSRAAIARTDSPAASPTAISSRSATDRYRPHRPPRPVRLHPARLPEPPRTPSPDQPRSRRPLPQHPTPTGFLPRTAPAQPSAPQGGRSFITATSIIRRCDDY